MTEEKKLLPLKPGIMLMPEKEGDEPKLQGCKCKDCGTHFYPQRHICLNCEAENMETANFSGKGEVYTFTIARQQLPGALVQVPYAIVIADMEEGCQIHSVVTEGYENVAVGKKIETYFEKVLVDKDGNDRLAHKFRVI
mgnify:CR=1 FL=1